CAQPFSVLETAGGDRKDRCCEPIVSCVRIFSATGIGGPMRRIVDADDPVALRGRRDRSHIFIEIGCEIRRHAETFRSWWKCAALTGRGSAVWIPWKCSVRGEGAKHCAIECRIVRVRCAWTPRSALHEEKLFAAEV